MGLRFWLESFTARSPFDALECEVRMAGDMTSPEVLRTPVGVPCPPVTQDMVVNKMVELGQSLSNQNTIASICSDLLGVSVHTAYVGDLPDPAIPSIAPVVIEMIMDAVVVGLVAQDLQGQPLPIVRKPV